MIAFDRQERGTGADELPATEEFYRKYGVRVVAASNLDDLIDVLENCPRYIPKAKATLPLILAYRERYGIR
jgi:orotate phosphoribosyltransferase